MAVNKTNLIIIRIVFEIVFLTITRANDDNYRNLDLKKCLKSMRIYCYDREPTALQCAHTALLEWKYSHHPLDKNIKEYHAVLFDKLNKDNIRTPSDFCHNKTVRVRQRCKEDLKKYFVSEQHSAKVIRKSREQKLQRIVRSYRCSKKIQRQHAVHYAFFYAVQIHAGDSVNDAQSFEDMYILEIKDNMTLMDDVDSPEVFCRKKYQPDYEKPAVL